MNTWPKDTPQAQICDKIVRLCQAMQEAARGKQWAILTRLEETRQGLFERLFAEPIKAVDSDAVAEFIQRILVIDREIIRLVKEGMELVGKEVSQIVLSKKAIQSYRSSGSDCGM